MNEYDREHLRRLEAIQRQIDAIYDEAVKEAAALGVTIDMPADAEPFTFADYPMTRKRVDELLKNLRSQLQMAIVNAVRSSWTLANNKNNELCNVVFGDRVGQLSQEQYRRYYSTNDRAREAFLSRKENGLNLSDRVWHYSDLFRREIEMGLDLGIRSGLDAPAMARDLKQYLRHPDKLFRRVRDEHGILHLSKNAAAFHPGRGVYRSSYLNARRLAATETNMAYRTADHERWKKMDFVVGIEIHLSKNHTCLGRDGKPHEFTDICDELKGKYPKDFKFTGWHPHCRCYATSILKTDEELAEDTRRILNGEQPTEGSVNTVEDVPEGFSKWVEKNEERIADARKKGTLPYFLRENSGYVGMKLEGKEDKTASVSAEPKQERSTDIHDLMDTMSPELRARMELLHERSREYRRLFDDPDYRDVEFNPTNGGLRATHINHKTHPNDNKRYFPELLTGDDLEDEFQRIAFEKGHSVIFREEAENTTDLDMFLDGVKMDLISVTSNSPIFKNQLKRKNGQLKDYNALYGENNESVCMYFHDPSFYTEDKVRQGINRLKEMGTDVKIKKVYVMLNDDSDMIEIILE